MYFKTIRLLLLILCFALPGISEAALKKDSKILPIKESNYKKDTVGPKKAVKTTTTETSQKNSKSTEKTSKITSNNNSKSSVTASSPIKVTQPTKTNLAVEKTTRKERVKEPELKVKLGTGSYGQVKIIFPNGGQLQNANGKRIKALNSNETFSWTNDIKDQLEEYQKKKKNKKNKNLKQPKIEYLNETVIFAPNKNVFSFNGTEYRGKLSVRFTSSGATAVNLVDLEDYLRGVVGSEIGSRSPEESLKAQTVIARTYAYANKGRHGSDGADVCNTTHCQVYSGIKAERDTVDAAVKATKAYILAHNSQPISTLYHATCGGMTSDNDAVFGGSPQPYLRRVQCPFCSNGSKYRWNQEISVSELQKALAKENVKLSDVYGVTIEAPSKMDRVSYMVFQTKTGEQKIKGTTIRRIFNLPSTTFILGNRAETAEIIASAKPVQEKPSKPTTNSKTNNIMITTFSDIQQSPRQLLVYTRGGLTRSKMPEDGWKCISHSSSKVKQLINDKPEKKKANAILTSSYATKKAKPLKTITKINLFGRGFGHQVGLCQSGAVEMGKQGWNYRQILAHYYHEVALKSLGY